MRDDAGSAIGHTGLKAYICEHERYLANGAVDI